MGVRLLIGKDIVGDLFRFEYGVFCVDVVGELGYDVDC